MKSTARGTALGIFFGGVAFLVTKTLVGHIGWQTALAGSTGILFGRAIAGDFDDSVSSTSVQSLNNVDTTSQLTEAEQLNDYAVQLSMSGNLKTAMEHWTKAALAGVPNALASYTWYALREGRYQDAITLYEACIDKIRKSKDSYQIVNCESNYALNLAALNSDFAKAIEISKGSMLIDHPDARFFLVMFEYLHGNKERGKQIFEGIPKSSHREIEDLLIEESLNSIGWFKDWCIEGRKVLKELQNI